MDRIVGVDQPLPQREIEQSRGKLLLGILGCLGFIVLGWLMAAGAFGHGTGRYAGLAEPIGVAAVVTFGTFGAIAVWRVLRWKGPEITLSSDSIRDKKVSDDPIPWSEVTNISPHVFRGKVIGSKLHLSAAFLSRIRLRLFVKLFGPATGTLGSDFVVAGPGAVKLSAGEFHDLAVAYWTAYHHREVDR